MVRHRGRSPRALPPPAPGSGNDHRIRIAFVKYAGLASGGTERWLQTIAASLPRQEFAVDYFYSDSVPYIGSDQRARGTDPARKQWMEERGVSLIEFHLEAVDLTRPMKPWMGTDFWRVLDPSRYDLVQTAKEGPAEYPYPFLGLPVVEFVAYNGGVDYSANTVASIHPSQWQRAWWIRRGGDAARTAVVPVPVATPLAKGNLRGELGIEPGSVVAGFHQRPDDRIFSPLPLEAFARIWRADRHFVVLGGSARYAAQVKDLGIPNVHFVTATADDEAISRFLNTLDVLAHGRRDGETFGAVFVEAMVHGVPCISHRVPAGGNAQRETIGPAGFVVDTLDDYAACLDRVMSDGELRARLAAKGRAHASERYSLESAVVRMQAVYRGVHAGRRSFAPPQPMPYGEAPAGFLIAGDIADPSHPSHCVLSGVTPRSRQVALLRHVLADVRALVEVGADRPVLALHAAQWSECTLDITVVETRPDTCEATRVALALNNWEQRIRLLHAEGCTADLGTDRVSDSGALPADGRPAVLSVCEGSAWWIDRQPLGSGVVSIALEPGIGSGVAAHLEEHGFRLIRGSGWAVREGVNGGRSVKALRRVDLRASAVDAVGRTRAAALRLGMPVRTRIARPVLAAARRIASSTPQDSTKGVATRHALIMATGLKPTLRSTALWLAPHGVIEAARQYQVLRAGGLAPRRALTLAASTPARNHLRNTRLGLLPAAELEALDVVVDVGANVGDWTAGVLAVASPRRILAVEPTPRIAEGLRERFAGRPEVEVVAAAAGPQDGTVQFHLTSHSHNSSVLLGREEMSGVLSGGIEVVETVAVPQVRLDTLLAGLHVSLLKIDVQGYEQAVLAGAEDVLRRTKWVLLEANFVSHYEGDTLLPELHQMMLDRGFELSNLSQPLVAQGQALFSDALYRRAAQSH